MSAEQPVARFQSSGASTPAARLCQDVRRHDSHSTDLALMSGDRFRQPIDADYSLAIGTAVFCFAICEWNAVYCAERISPGSLGKIVKDELTAGKIAKKLLDLTRNMPTSKEREELMTAVKSFSDLVNLRNSIVHGKPCTGLSGQARLSSTTVLEISDISLPQMRLAHVASN